MENESEKPKERGIIINDGQPVPDKKPKRKAIIIVAGGILGLDEKTREMLRKTYGDTMEVISPEEAKEQGIKPPPVFKKSEPLKITDFDTSKLIQNAHIAPEGKWYNQFNKNKKKRW